MSDIIDLTKPLSDSIQKLQNAPLTLGGINGTFSGDTSLLQNLDVTDANGIPVPLASARPNEQQQTQPSTWWDKYLQNFGHMQDNAIDNPNVAIADISGVTPNDLATGKASVSRDLFADIAAVMVGLVLIAGAIFSFSQVKDTIVTTAKGAATLAA
jgi:hypothetical protein